MGNPHLDLAISCRNPRMMALMVHGKFLSLSAIEILVRWRQLEILISIIRGNPRAMAPMGNTYLDHGDSSMEIRGQWCSWEILVGISHGNPRAMARMGSIQIKYGNKMSLMRNEKGELRGNLTMWFFQPGSGPGRNICAQIFSPNLDSFKIPAQFRIMATGHWPRGAAGSGH